MRYRLLCPLEIIGDDGSVSVAGRERVLLATLGLGADNALQVHVSKLRKELAAARAGDNVSSTPQGYVLRTKPNEVDIEEFQQLATAATGDPTEISTRLRQALAPWRGPALADVSSELLNGETARLEELRQLVLSRRIEADLALSRDLGIDPGPDLQALERAIVNRDPDITAPTQVTSLSAAVS
jgi:DNA-binding SARP family transcriptional activator